MWKGFEGPRIGPSNGLRGASVTRNGSEGHRRLGRALAKVALLLAAIFAYALGFLSARASADQVEARWVVDGDTLDVCGPRRP